MPAFQNKAVVPHSLEILRTEALAHARHQLILPPLAEVWSATKHLPHFDEKAHATIGFYFYAEDDKDYPVGEVQVSKKKMPDFYQGFLLAEGTPDTHLIPKLEWLNQKKEIIRRKCGGTKRDEPRVVMNHVRTGGGAWRHKAFLDAVGRPATDAFLLLSPLATYWSLELLWALANGPFASAFTLTNSTSKQIGVRLVKRMPVPTINKLPVTLVAAVQAYLDAAREFSSRFTDEEQKKMRSDAQQKRRQAIRSKKDGKRYAGITIRRWQCSSAGGDSTSQRTPARPTLACGCRGLETLRAARRTRTRVAGFL